MSSPPFKVKAIYEYTSAHDDDLHFPNGQIITVTEEEDDDWYSGEYVDASGVKQEGIFPKNFVEKYEPTAPPRPTRTTRPKKEPEPEPEPEVVSQAPQHVEEPAPEPEAEEVAEPVTAREPPPSLPSKPEITSPVEERPAAASPPPAKVAPQSIPAQSKASPPPVSEKPIGGSFRDRIAAFNKAAAPPVAPFKPGGLSSGGSSFIKKPFVAPPPSKDAYVPPPREVPQSTIYRREEDPEIAAKETENLENAERAGLVPTNEMGEEEDQPKPTSLKERIALLQKQQAEQAARHADAAQKKEKPKKPVKKRNESQGPPEAQEGEGAPLEKFESADTVTRQSIDSTREETSAPRPMPMPRRKSSKGPGAVHVSHQPQSFNDGNEADMSGAGDTTEEPEDMSTGGDYSDDKPRSRPPALPAKAPEAPAREPDVGEEEGAVEEPNDEPEAEEEAEEEEEEDDVDPEIRRKEEIRARMAKMSGGMGMHGMFGPPGGMPMPSIAVQPKKKKPSASSERQASEDREETVSPSARAPPVPIMALPGMARVKSPEETNRPLEVELESESVEPTISARQPDEVPDMEDIRPAPPSRPTVENSEIQSTLYGILKWNCTKLSAGPTGERAAPPIPGGRPAPPPVPSECRLLSISIKSSLSNFFQLDQLPPRHQYLQVLARSQTTKCLFELRD
jgi:hypothetical protein